MSQSFDAYKIPEGSELDALIHTRVFEAKPGSAPPPYSTDEELGKKVFKRLRSKHNRSIVMGSTRIRGKKWYFARYGSDPSTSTEVLSPTLPLSICRLALLLERDQ